MSGSGVRAASYKRRGGGMRRAAAARPTSRERRPPLVDARGVTDETTLRRRVLVDELVVADGLGSCGLGRRCRLSALDRSALLVIHYRVDVPAKVTHALLR